MDELVHLGIAVSIAAACYFACTLYARVVGLPLTRYNFRHGTRRGIQNIDADEEADAYMRRMKVALLLFLGLGLLAYATTEIFEWYPL